MQSLKNIVRRLSTVSGAFRGQRRTAKAPRSVSLTVETLESRLVPTTGAAPSLLPIPPIHLPIILPGSPAWFQANMTDPGVRSLAASDFANHGSITRNDMLGIFTEVENNGTMTAAELHDLKFLVANAGVLHMPADVTFEATEVIDSCTAGIRIIGPRDLITLRFGTQPAQLAGLVDQWFMGFDHPTASASYVNVNGSLFANGTPYYTDVNQGALGDCWLLASLAEVAAREPYVIESMFTADGTAVENGTTVAIWSVRFFENGQAKYVTVDSELPAAGGYYDHIPADGALWVALAEKAYAEANGDGFVTTGQPNTNSYAALNDGWPSWALPAITGQSAAEYSVNPTNIVNAWNQGQLIVLCTSNPVSQDIVGSHCYALVNYTPSAGDPFEIYNPWGTTASGYAPYTDNGHEVYGLFICNAPFLSQNFSKQSITSAAPSVASQTVVAEVSVPNLATAHDSHASGVDEILALEALA